MYKNDAKTSGLQHSMTLKIPKTPFFTKKYVTKYTPETFFEDYINFKFFVT
jgi:hypothetical protein